MAEANIFIGAYLPQPFIESITLLALAKGAPKTDILYQFVQSKLTNFTEIEDDVHTNIAQNALWEFMKDQARPKMQRKYKNWYLFITQCKNELKNKKKLREETAIKIMNKLLSLKKHDH